MNEYNLDDDDDPIGAPIFGKSISQEDRMRADLKEDSMDRRRLRRALYRSGQQAARECSQEIRHREA